jgi:hypothetical protein
MRITKHITFFYLENRIQYVNKIIEETNNYNYPTDIFIHTNYLFLSVGNFTKYTNGSIIIVSHYLLNEHPFYLTWKSRKVMEKLRNDYDIFIYLEDDILIPYKTIEYWEKYHVELLENGYNLGFVRIETKDGEEFITDIISNGLTDNISLNEITYAVNNNNPYCGFWIYDKKEFNRFVDSIYWDPNNVTGYDIRERSAVGLHGFFTTWYKGTLIPIIDKKLIDDCRVYHLPNNYVDSNSPFGKLKFNEVCKNIQLL